MAARTVKSENNGSGAEPVAKNPPSPRRSRSRSTSESKERSAQDVLAEESESMEEPASPELPDERARKWRTPGFHRFEANWDREDGFVVVQMRTAIRKRMENTFSDAYQIMFEIHDLVRTKTGEIDGDGLPVYEKSITGNYAEDWTKLAHREKENFMFTITTRIFAWDQASNEIWAEAMYAKGKFEERFAIGYDAGVAGTIDDRRAKGNKEAAEERYFAIYLSALSRQAEALVRTMNLIAQRIQSTL